MAEETKVENTTEQESPTVEQNQVEANETETAEKPEETPEEQAETQSETAEDKNWKQMRERMRELETENKRLKGEDNSSFEGAKKSEVITPFLSADEKTTLQFDEFKAQQQIPELDPDSDSYSKIFDNAVAGQYTAELNAYARGKMSGRTRPLPSPTQIAKELKKEWDAAIKASGEKTKSETLKKAKENLAKKEATVSAEGRSDGRPNASREDLVARSRRGDKAAIAERLRLSEL